MNTPKIEINVDDTDIEGLRRLERNLYLAMVAVKTAIAACTTLTTTQAASAKYTESKIRWFDGVQSQFTWHDAMRAPGAGGPYKVRQEIKVLLATGKIVIAQHGAGQRRAIYQKV